MIVLPPIDITTDMLTSTVPYPDSAIDISVTEWAQGAAYVVGAQVYRDSTKLIYKCISTVVLSSAASMEYPEVNIYSTTPYWEPVKSVNRWAMFDYLRNYKTEAASVIDFTLAPGTRFDSIALTGLEGVTTVSIVVTLSGGSTITVINGAYTGSTYIYTGIPPFYNSTVRVVLSGPSTVKCRNCMIGVHVDVGMFQTGGTVDSTSYSKIERDLYGNSNLVRRRAINKVSGSLMIRAEALDKVSRLRQSLNAKPALWCGLDQDTTSDYATSLTVFGIYKTFSFDLSNPIVAMASIEIEEI